MKLADFQSLFQARVLAGAGEADAPLIEALRFSRRGADRATLLGVYQNGFRVRLADFLEEDHSGLRALLGDEAFDSLVEDYIAARPPRDRNARWYTTGLPDFMRESERWRDDRRAISMALFERAMVDAFDAADTPTLRITTLSDFEPEDWPRLVFGFHPSLTILELAAGTLDSYDDSTADDEAEETPAPRESIQTVETVAVWRVGEESAYRELESDEFVALSEAKAGRAFGDICQMTAFQHSGEIEPERLAQCLASWFEEGMVISAEARDEE